MSQLLPLDELSLTFARIKGLLMTEEKVDRAVQLLAEGIRDAFPGSVGAGVSLLDELGRRTSTGSTHQVVARADQAQYELGEGPCLTAWATDQTVIMYNIATEDRWPSWARAVNDLPIKSAISTPLMMGAKSLGALKVYSGTPGTYDAGTARPLEKFASTAAILLNNIQAGGVPKRLGKALTTALSGRDVINRAQGALMQLHGLGEEDALRRLLDLARTSRLPLVTVSEGVLARAGKGHQARA